MDEQSLEQFCLCATHKQKNAEIRRQAAEIERLQKAIGKLADSTNYHVDRDYEISWDDMDSPDYTPWKYAERVRDGGEA